MQDVSHSFFIDRMTKLRMTDRQNFIVEIEFAFINFEKKQSY